MMIFHMVKIINMVRPECAEHKMTQYCTILHMFNFYPVYCTIHKIYYITYIII